MNINQRVKSSGRGRRRLERRKVPEKLDSKLSSCPETKDMAS
jgi:hypothetical protein